MIQKQDKKDKSEEAWVRSLLILQQIAEKLNFDIEQDDK